MKPDGQEVDTASFSDNQLLNDYRRGDQAAAEKLFFRYYTGLLWRVRQRMGWLRNVEESEDVALSVLASVLHPEKDVYALPDAGLWPLLSKIADNKIRTHIQHWKRKIRDPNSVVSIDDNDPLVIGPTPEDAMRVEEAIRHLRESFDNEKRRSMIDCLLQGMSVAETARQVGRAERTVYKTRDAARQLLEKMAGDM